MCVCARAVGPRAGPAARVAAARTVSMCAVAEKRTIGTFSPTFSRIQPMISSDVRPRSRLTSRRMMWNASSGGASAIACITPSMLGTSCTASCSGRLEARYCSLVEEKRCAIAVRSNR